MLGISGNINLKNFTISVHMSCFLIIIRLLLELVVDRTFHGPVFIINATILGQQRMFLIPDKLIKGGTLEFAHG